MAALLAWSRALVQGEEIINISTRLWLRLACLQDLPDLCTVSKTFLLSDPTP
jgi:hypothetical protein